MLIDYKGYEGFKTKVTKLGYLNDKVDQGFKDMGNALKRTDQDMSSVLNSPGQFSNPYSRCRRQSPVSHQTFDSSGARLI